MPDASVSPLADPQRLAALVACGLFGSPVEDWSERFARVARRALRAPVALLTLVGPDSQFVKAQEGLSEPWAQRRELPLDYSFCQHAVVQGRPFVVADARGEPLVCDSPALEDIGVVAYAGCPVFSPDGHALGALCVIDDQPRRWSAEDIEMLSDLAALVSGELDRRIAVRHAIAGRAEAEAAQKELRALAERDDLTGTLNRRGLVQALGDGPLDGALVAVDVDCLKAVNDSHGHDAGDAVLRDLAATLVANVRAGDDVARLSGDEFVVYMRGADAAGARRTAACVLDVTRAAAQAAPGRASTVSVGVVVVRGAVFADALTRADAALYDAKRGGRNRMKVVEG